MGAFLFDEHLPRWWRRTIIELDATIDIRYVGEPGAPPLHAPDEVLLDWCERFDAILVTNNRSSMPDHLADHLAAGKHIPGIFLVQPMLDPHIWANSLAYIVGASLPNEYQDRIVYPPLIPM